MKNKGYLIYELLLSFTFLFVVIINMLSVITTLQTKLNSVYKNNKVLAQQLIIQKLINDDFMKYKINRIESCGAVTNCIKISYVDQDNTSKFFSKNLTIDNTNLKIVYGDQEVKFPDYVEIGSAYIQPIFTASTYEKYDKIFKLFIPISTKDKKYDMLIFYVNQSDELTTSDIVLINSSNITIPITNITRKVNIDRNNINNITRISDNEVIINTSSDVKNIKIDNENNKISYGIEEVVFPKDTNFGNIQLTTSNRIKNVRHGDCTDTTYETYGSISIPITYSKKHFSIHISNLLENTHTFTTTSCSY